MALAISVNKFQHRFDSTRYPRITASGITDVGRIKIENWEYRNAFNDTFVWTPPNRSKKVCNIELRNVFFPDWEVDAGVTEEGTNATIANTGADGWKGAYYDTELDPAQCSIEAQVRSTMLSTGISLQSGTIEHDYMAVGSSVEHSMIAGQEALGSIRELGVFIKHFPYEENDKFIIEHTDTDAGGIVRYYLVKPGGRLILLRTTRSKLTGAPKAEVLVYAAASYLTDIRIYNGEKESASIETIGAITRLQSWNDDYSFLSNAETIQLADNAIEETFPASKNVLRSLMATRELVPVAERNAFADFFEWHRNSQEFIFVDNARQDRNLRVGENEEFWARFATPFGDKAKKCLFGEAVQILEVQRDDYVPVEFEVDTTPPEIELYEPLIGGDLINISADASDNVGVNYVQFFYEAIQIGGNVYSGAPDTTFQTVWDISALALGDYDLTAIAFDFAGNSTQSNTVIVTLP